MIRKVTLYQEIEKWLKTKIQEGEITDKLPSERELCHTFGVTPITVRRALRELINEGNVYSHQGKGYFVVKQRKVSKKTLRIGTYPIHPSLKVQRRIFEEFEKKHRGVKIEHLLIHNQYVEFLESQFSSGEAPDILMLSEAQFPYFASQGLLSPVEEPQGDYWKEPFSLFYWRGSLYAVPFIFSTVVLLINKGIVEDRDINSLECIEWRDWKKILKKYTSEDGKKFFGVSFPYENLNRWPVFLKQNGGGIVERGKIAINTLPSQDALHELRSLHLTEKVTPSLTTNAYLLFRQGGASMTLASFYMMGSLESKKDLRWRALPLPYLGKPLTALLSTSFGINRFTKEQPLCQEFLRFVISPSIQKIIKEEKVSLPVSTPETNSMNILKGYPLEQELSRAEQILRTPLYEHVHDILSRELYSFWLGTEEEEITKRIGKEIREIVRGEKPGERTQLLSESVI